MEHEHTEQTEPEAAAAEESPAAAATESLTGSEDAGRVEDLPVEDDGQDGRAGRAAQLRRLSRYRNFTGEKPPAARCAETIAGPLDLRPGGPHAPVRPPLADRAPPHP